jgi:hypothetical protein
MADEQAEARLLEVDYMPRLAGESYRKFLRKLHLVLQPQTYLEIGTQDGGSLRFANCKSIAVDPQFRLKFLEVLGTKPVCHLFQMSSDAFFSAYNPGALFEAPIDMAFLDGMHLFEFLLRDIANTEKYCKRNSIILLHDCIPPALLTTGRKAGSTLQRSGLYPDFWAGDVWKVVPILRKYRPDLRISCFDAPPTGMVAITNLDSGNSLLTDKYFEIVDLFSGSELDELRFNEYWAEIDLIPTSTAASREDLARYFWL